MWKRLNVPFIQMATIRNCSNRKRLKRKLSIMGQDQEKFPEFEYNRSKPTDHRVYVWGMAETGALGIHQKIADQKKANTVKYPTRLPFAERFDVLDCAAGYGFTLFACEPQEDGISLFGTGINTDSQIGFHKLGGITNKPMEAMIYPSPITLPKIRDDEKVNIVKCAAGRAHSIVLSEAGIIYTMGNNAFGQCARPIIEDEKYEASQMIHRIDSKSLIGDDDAVKDVVCGQDHSLLLTQKGKVFACGWGADGQTGLGHYNSIGEWGQVGGDIANEKIVKVASKVDCVLALNEKGEVFGWGNSEYCQLDTSGERPQINTPIHLKTLQDCGKIIDVGVGGSSCIALNRNGEVFVWGFGLLGVGPLVENLKEPKNVPSALFGRNDFNPDSQVTAVYSGFSHMGAVTTTHDLYMWGRNRSACLGLRHEKDQYFPFKVAISAMVQKIDCGVDHTIAYCKPFM